jgi:hypothetical protein
LQCCLQLLICATTQMLIQPQSISQLPYRIKHNLHKLHTKISLTCEQPVIQRLE